MTDAKDRRLVAFFAPQFVLDAIDQAAECALTNRSTFLRQAVWRDISRQGWTADDRIPGGEQPSRLDEPDYGWLDDLLMSADLRTAH